MHGGRRQRMVPLKNLRSEPGVGRAGIILAISKAVDAATPRKGA